MLRVQESNISKPKRRVSASRKVQKKYRRAFQRQLQKKEYARLASVIPTFADAPEVNEVDVVEGAIQYIEELHRQIVDRMMNGEKNIHLFIIQLFIYAILY